MTAIFTSTTQIMRQVIYALSLGVGASYYFFGWGIIVQIILAIITAIAAESAFLKIRKLPIKPVIFDGSAILTAILLAISIPSIAPWWVIVLGVSFAIIFGKQLYGGLGNNPFNPAMVGYGFLLISYPLQMTTWAVDFVGLGAAFDVIFHLNSVDAISGATRLDEVRVQLGLGKSINDLSLHSAAAAWINAGFLLGGLYLLLRRVVFWHIPAAFLTGMIVTAFLLSFGAGEHL
ncbi:MAG: RnfABCDGE type electron transport complex subunit D, partial [Candidatus Thioglobus sp.]